MKSFKNTFRYNKKRKHYSYIYKIKGDYCFNILLTTKQVSKQRKHKRTVAIKNILLFKNPNKNSCKLVFIYNHPPYIDNVVSFDVKKLPWEWDINDKRKVKLFKK